MTAAAGEGVGLVPHEERVTPLTVLIAPESAYGPTNNCVGIGDVLSRRGHRVVFAAEASWKGRLEPLGFEEELVDLAPPPEQPQDAGQFWKDFVPRHRARVP
jgi:UDP:flavonoid glycosyltransferase YjiC (YdhE family)